MIRDKFIHFNGSRLHYAQAGNGEKALLVFHGFGQDISAFEFLARSLTREYTVYVFDLYFHGASAWAHGERPLEKDEWHATLQLFLEQHEISTFSLAGYSLGGKFVLATLERFADRISALFLIAPDGIKTSFWYSLATWPVLFRKLFRSMIAKPQRFVRLTRGLNRAGLVDTGLIRFAEYQMSTRERRERVYLSWVVFRHLTFNLGRVAALINRHRIPLTLIAGRYDKVVAPGNMRRFLGQVREYRFEVLESGHTGLINASLPYFTSTARSR